MENNDLEQKRRSRDRSPSFPIITLEQAIGRAKEFYDQEKRGSAPYQVVAKHWGYSPSSSGALQTVSAMKQYGLMTEEGGTGNERKVRLTELALRILLDTRPDSIERAEFMAQAARMPTVVGEILQKWPDTLPSPDTLNHYLVLERQFNEATAAKAVKIINGNKAFTGGFGNVMLSELSKMETDSMSRQAVPMRVEMDQNLVADARVISTRAGGSNEVASFPVAKNQVVKLVTTGILTKPAVEALVKQLQLGVELGLFPDSTPE